MRITDAFIQSGAIREVQKAGGVKPEKKSEGSDKVARSSDSVSISNAARSASGVDKVKAHVQSLPENREDKIATAKARMQSGYYNSPEFRDQLAEKLAKEFGANG